MKYLNQNCVPQGTYRKRANRSKRNVMAFFQDLESKELSEQEPDFKLTNLDNFSVDMRNVSKEAVELLKLVTFLVQKTGASAWVVFEATNPKKLNWLRST